MKERPRWKKLDCLKGDNRPAILAISKMAKTVLKIEIKISTPFVIEMGLQRWLFVMDNRTSY